MAYPSKETVKEFLFRRLIAGQLHDGFRGPPWIIKISALLTNLWVGSWVIGAVLFAVGVLFFLLPFPEAWKQQSREVVSSSEWLMILLAGWMLGLFVCGLLCFAVEGLWEWYERRRLPAEKLRQLLSELEADGIITHSFDQSIRVGYWRRITHEDRTWPQNWFLVLRGMTAEGVQTLLCPPDSTMADDYGETWHWRCGTLKRCSPSVTFSHGGIAVDKRLRSG